MPDTHITRRECPEHGDCSSQLGCPTHAGGGCCCDNMASWVERTFVAVDALLSKIEALTVKSDYDNEAWLDRDEVLAAIRAATTGEQR